MEGGTGMSSVTLHQWTQQTKQAWGTPRDRAKGVGRLQVEALLIITPRPSGSSICIVTRVETQSKSFSWPGLGIEASGRDWTTT